MLRRCQLFEFEDLSWFPDIWRRAITRNLRTAVGLSGLPARWAEILAKLGPESDRDFRIVDLGSGSGGPISSIILELRRRGYSPTVTLTDLYPNPESFPSEHNAEGSEVVQYWPEPVDATRVPSDFAGVRTMFTSFHHHPPERARAILRDAFDKRIAIGVFECTARKPITILNTLLSPVRAFVITPLIRPLKVSQFFFTYLIPVVTICLFWDGLVSQLRTYSVSELEEMTADMQSPDYVWKTGEVKVPLIPSAVPWLTGCPKQDSVMDVGFGENS